MTDELRSRTWNELRVRGQSVSSPVTRGNRVVDLLHLDTRHKTVVGFMPITVLEIPLRFAELVRSDGTHVDQKTISLADTTPIGTKTFKIPSTRRARSGSAFRYVAQREMVH